MKRLCRWPLYLVATLLWLAGPVDTASAQIERAPLIGVIDIQAVLRESSAVQSLSRKIEAQRDNLQDSLKDREEALRAADLDLAQRRADLSSEQYANERSELEAEGIALQREGQEQRRRLDQVFSRGMGQVQQVLIQISQEIARENDLDLVLAKTTVILVRPEFDFTKEALQRLNARLAEVDLPEISK